MRYVLIDSDKNSNFFNSSLKEHQELPFSFQIEISVIIFINLNTLPIYQDQLKLNPQFRRTAFFGIEILKYLRAKGIKNHCIAYTFLSVQNILKGHPEHHIICSPGTTFLRLPTMIPNLDKLKADVIKDQSILLPYFRSAFDFSAYRHEMANYYGLDSFYSTYNLLSDFKTPIRIATINDKRNDLNYLLARVQYTSENSDKNASAMDVRIARKRIDYRLPRKRTILHIDDHGSTGWSELFFRALFLKDPLAIKIVDKVPKKRELVIYQINKRHLTSYYYKDYILHSYTGYPCSQNEEEFHIVNIKDFIENNEVNLILLDLRLQGEFSENNDIKAISGYRLLSKLRVDYYHNTCRYAGVPIMLTTSSNNQKKLMTMNNMIEAYWIKEGMEENTTMKQSLNNYVTFLLNCRLLLSEEFQTCVADFARDIYDFKFSSNEYWWTKPEIDDINFQNFNTYNPDIDKRKEKICSLLYLILQQLRNYFKFSKQDNEFAIADFVNGIALNIGKIVEIVHRTDIMMEINGQVSGLTDLLLKRNDLLGAYFYRLRNKATHFESSNKAPTFLILNMIIGIDIIPLVNKDEANKRLLPLNKMSLMKYLSTYNPNADKI